MLVQVLAASPDLMTKLSPLQSIIVKDYEGDIQPPWSERDLSCWLVCRARSEYSYTVVKTSRRHFRIRATKFDSQSRLNTASSGAIPEILLLGGGGAQ